MLEELKLHNPLVASRQDLCILESRGGRRFIRGIHFVLIFFRIILFFLFLLGLSFLELLEYSGVDISLFLGGGVGGIIRRIFRYFAIYLICRFPVWDTERYVEESFP